MLVVGAADVEDRGRGPSYTRLSQLANYSAASLHAFLAANLAPGATAKTDGWSGYPVAMTPSRRRNGRPRRSDLIAIHSSELYSIC
jgi:hypothetical protein